MAVHVFDVLRDTCPCGSGELIVQCDCLQPDGRLLPREVVVPKGPHHKVKYGHPKCFAQALGNCSRQISREHYISRGVIREIQKTYLPRERLKVGGFPWQPSNALREVGASALVSKVLCNRHNSLLACLDKVGAQFFRAFHRINLELRTHPAPRPYYLFNGHDVERWMLKTLCGIIASGSTNNIPKEVKPPRDYLECIFDAEKMPATWGLYLVPSPGLRPASGGLSMATICDGRIIHGLVMHVLAFEFVPAIHAIPEKTGLLAGAINRPDALHFRCAESRGESTVLFGWEVMGDGGTVEIAAGFDS